MKSRHLLAQKMELFYRNIQPKRQQVAKNEKMRLQVDLEFQQNEIKRLDKKHKVEMISSRMKARQKTREFKKLLFKSKRAHKATSTSSIFDPKNLIHKATANMNNAQSQKYGYPPETIEENAIRSEKFRDIYDFYRLLKEQKHAERYIHGDAKKDKFLRRRLRKPLKVGERMLALAECLKKNDAPKYLYKSTTEMVSFFDREQIFVVRKVVKTSKDNYLYWISKKGNNKIIDKLFLRQELFALNDQFA